ncbi:MAG TPA: hypothetical protein VGH24_10125 [Solirubrobacteraceae bacterium]|jgi:hypothetical protein
MPRRLAVVFIGLALALPAIALAAGKTSPPSDAQRAAILKAFGSRSKAESNCMVVLLAASNHKYATVRPHVNRACTKYEFNGKNVFKNTSDNHWKSVFAGSSYKCFLPNIPHQVQRDLAVCPH